MSTAPPLSVDQILAWADAHFQRTGAYPHIHSGPVVGGFPGDKWLRIDNALRYGWRGLPPGSSLPRLLAQERGARNALNRLPLTEEQILAWADEHFRRTGRYPTRYSGPVLGAPGLKWITVDHYLFAGKRGLPGRTSLARLLKEKLRVNTGPTSLTRQKVLKWARAYKRSTGRWPHARSGRIAESPDDTWKVVDDALRAGTRGLPGGSSLAKLLAETSGSEKRLHRPALCEEEIVAWAISHLRHTGKWPHARSGRIPGSGGETWEQVDRALRHGLRGLPGGDSLTKLLKRKLG